MNGVVQLLEGSLRMHILFRTTDFNDNLINKYDKFIRQFLRIYYTFNRSEQLRITSKGAITERLSYELEHPEKSKAMFLCHVPDYIRCLGHLRDLDGTLSEHFMKFVRCMYQKIFKGFDGLDGRLMKRL